MGDQAAVQYEHDLVLGYRPYALGNYRVVVWANQAGNPTRTYEAYGLMDYTLGGCMGATLGVSPTSPAESSSVMFTATAPSCVNPRYEYWLQHAGGSWIMEQPFSSVNQTWTWNTAAFLPGELQHRGLGQREWRPHLKLRVLCRWPVHVDLGAVHLVDRHCIAARQRLGRITGDHHRKRHRCLPKPRLSVLDAGSWRNHMEAGPALQHQPDLCLEHRGQGRRDLPLSVWVRDASSVGTQGNSLGRWDAYKSTQYTLTSTPCPSSSLRVTAAPPGSAVVGTPGHFHRQRQRCRPSPSYQLRMLAPGSTTAAGAAIRQRDHHLDRQARSAAPTTSPVWVRDASSIGTSGNSLGRWDAYYSAVYSLT